MSQEYLDDNTPLKTAWKIWQMKNKQTITYENWINNVCFKEVKP